VGTEIAGMCGVFCALAEFPSGNAQLSVEVMRHANNLSVGSVKIVFQNLGAVILI